MVHDGLVVACHTHTVQSAEGGLFVFVSVCPIGGIDICRLLGYDFPTGEPLVSQAHPHETGDAVTLHAERTGTEHDAIAGGGLTGYRHIFVCTGQTTLQGDDSCHVKDDGTWTADLLDTVTERAFYGVVVVTVVVEGGDMVDTAATPADGITAVALCTGEGKTTGLELV